MSESKMREDFEDYITDQWEWPKAAETFSDGEYKLMQTAHAWQVWQAAYALYVEEPQK